MELTLYDKEGEYVGSCDYKDRTVPPEVVIYLHQAYVAQRPAGVRAGGIPRYVKANTYPTHHLRTATDEACPPPKKKRR